MGNTCARGISSSRPRMIYDAQVQTTPLQQAPSAPVANQSPLDGLVPPPPRGAGPSRPLRPVESWDKVSRQRVHDMAHDLFKSTSPILYKLDMSVQQDVIKLLKQMLARVGGELIHGGADDLMQRKKEIEKRIKDAPARNPATQIETAENRSVLDDMQQLMYSIELTLEAAKADDPSLMELVPCPLLNSGLVNAASDMASLFKTDADKTVAGLLIQKFETRIQNIFGKILKGESVPRGVANAVAGSKNDPAVLIGKLLALVERYPDLGKPRTAPP